MMNWMDLGIYAAFETRRTCSTDILRNLRILVI
jgi:hypothetical protein